MAVRIEFPNANNLIQYTPGTGGDILTTNFAGYIKGLNYYEYIFYVRLQPGGSFVIDKAPEDIINRDVISAVFSCNAIGADGLSVTASSSTIAISFISFPVASAEFYFRIITFDI